MVDLPMDTLQHQTVRRAAERKVQSAMEIFYAQ
jgi:hypothetical protein